MKPLIIVLFITAVGLLAAATGIPRSHSISTIGRAGTGQSSEHEHERREADAIRSHRVSHPGGVKITITESPPEVRENA